MSKVQGFKFVSKTIYNKLYTTNQKPKKLKQKKQKNKRHIGNKEKEKYLLKKYNFSTLDSRPLPVPTRRNVGG